MLLLIEFLWDCYSKLWFIFTFESNAFTMKEIMLKSKYLLCRINAFLKMGYWFFDVPICMNIYIYIYIYIHLNIYINVTISIWSWCTYTYMYIFIYHSMHAHAYAHIFWKHASLHIVMHQYSHLLFYIHTHFIPTFLV